MSWAQNIYIRYATNQTFTFISYVSCRVKFVKACTVYLSELLLRLEGASVTTWIFPVGNSFFQLFQQHMNAQAVMSPGDRKFQFQCEHMTATLQERRLKMSFFICWLYILFPPKNSINHTDLQNTSVQKTSTQEGDAFGICHTDWLTYTFEFSPLSAHSTRVFFSPILLVKVPFRCNRGSVHLATVSLSEECWMKLFAQA